MPTTAALNEAEAVLSKLPLDLPSQLGVGTVGARLRRLGSGASRQRVRGVAQRRCSTISSGGRDVLPSWRNACGDLLPLCGSTVTRDVGIRPFSASALSSSHLSPFAQELPCARCGRLATLVWVDTRLLLTSIPARGTSARWSRGPVPVLTPAPDPPLWPAPAGQRAPTGRGHLRLELVDELAGDDLDVRFLGHGTRGYGRDKAQLSCPS